MTRILWCRALLGLWVLGFVAGCGKKEPELVPDPALAGKPFPKVEAPPASVKAKPPSFPPVGGRPGGP